MSFIVKMLLEDIVPFRLSHGIDWEHSGMPAWMDEVGTVLSTDKYLWSQARPVWTFSALCNRI